MPPYRRRRRQAALTISFYLMAIKWNSANKPKWNQPNYFFVFFFFFFFFFTLIRDFLKIQSLFCKIMEVDHEGCKTPRRWESRIPTALACPPAPKKKLVYLKKRMPPKEGYFEPPDLEAFFVIAPKARKEACA
ncbi:hypothetical protein MANES_07G117700v8 [Manihot esculenta]|uniref:Uncharacterized protein n=1 Tax=Manihot esculenta TaxID=3983 RepID=A0ACB7HH95_MANES|nr:hypothetical protein MANES_07G117700v8 [Manihot esculenta]